MSINAAGGISFAPLQTGGIDPKSDGGIVGEPHAPLPGACEEKNEVYDWETGEMVYEDDYLKNLPGASTVCYLA